MNNLHLSYYEFKGRLYVTNEETKNPNLKNLTPEESKKASINSYGKVGQWGFGPMMEFFGYAVKVEGGNNIYFVNKKSYDAWLGRVNTLKNADDLTLENMTKVALETVKGGLLSQVSQEEKETETPRAIEKDLNQLFAKKMITEMENAAKIKFAENQKVLSEYRTKIDDFIKKTLNPKKSNIGKPTYGATLDRISPVGVDSLIRKLQKKTTSKDKLLVLQEFEQERIKNRIEGERDYLGTYKKRELTEDNNQFVMRIAIILSDPEVLRIIDKLPKEDNWDENVSQIYDNYKSALDYIMNHKWIE